MRYLPILKAKAAELGALREARSERAGMLPVVELLDNAVEAPALEATLPAMVEKVAQVWGDQHPIAIDSQYLGFDVLPSGATTIEAISAASGNCRTLPVARLNDSAESLRGTAAVAAADGRGVVLRIGDDDLEEDLRDLNVWIDDWLNDVNLNPGSVDLVLDMGVVTEGGLSPTTLVARTLATGVVHLAGWRSVTLAGGAFPQNLNAVPSGSSATIPRLDARLWATVSARATERSLDFGDYTISHPLLGDQARFAPAPQIRYAIDGEWVIRKGTKRDPLGHAQFYDICRELGTTGQVISVGTWGDDYIDDAAASTISAARVGPGNATTWRTVGTSHHMGLVVDRLASHGGP